jgi:hypothetical protein
VDIAKDVVDDVAAVQAAERIRRLVTRCRGQSRFREPLGDNSEYFSLV